MKKIFTLFLLFGALMYNAKAQTLLYSNDFEQGVNDAVIIGNGAVEDSDNPLFGKVFHNAVDGQGIRTNYLLLPDNIFADLQTAETNALTISFWVNVGTAVEYWFTPLFSAYGGAPVEGTNTWPMMILQSRGLVQVNNAGWCDFTNGQNVAGTNEEHTFWLDDNEWHFYTAVFTPTNVKVYIDGVVFNEWNISGEEDGGVASGLFTDGSALTYICLGGNQAWNWGDPDPAYLFDKVRIYSDALTTDQINAQIEADNNPSAIPTIASETISINYDAANEVINIAGLDGNEKIELVNVLGQRINVSNLSVIPTGNLNKGVYVLIVSKGSEVKTQKLLIR